MNSDSFSHEQEIIAILKALESKGDEYPPELLAARRTYFLEQLEKHQQFQAANEPAERDQELLKIFKNVKALEPEYPPAILARRRALFKQHLSETVPNTIWQVLRSAMLNLLAGKVTSRRPAAGRFARSVTLATGMVMIAFIAFALFGNIVRTDNALISKIPVSTPTLGQAPMTPPAAIVCAEGQASPLCLAVERDKSRNIAYTGNGKARPAVAKDSSNGQLNGAARVNDGLYGPSASWVSNSPNSWIKIDLGTTTSFNTVAFGRDRLGTLNDGDPGRFVIAVATSDDVYADGNSSNDEHEYVSVYDSEQAGFGGTISGAETVIALFDMKQARYIKITFENARTAIDEVEAFVSDPSLALIPITPTSPREDGPSNPSTALPANTPIPTNTATAVPVDTLPPTATLTPLPTDPSPTVETPTPIDTPTQVPPTVPPATDTPTPVDPTIPASTDTPASLPNEATIPAPTGSSSPGDDLFDPM